jgi:WD40 repeat protein
MTHSFVAHDDSVVGLAMLANRNEFFSCSHDATVKLWDIRKF